MYTFLQKCETANIDEDNHFINYFYAACILHKFYFAHGCPTIHIGHSARTSTTKTTHKVRGWNGRFLLNIKLRYFIVMLLSRLIAPDGLVDSVGYC